MSPRRFLTIFSGSPCSLRSPLSTAPPCHGLCHVEFFHPWLRMPIDTLSPTFQKTPMPQTSIAASGVLVRNLDLSHLWGFFLKELSFRGDTLTPCRFLPWTVFLHGALRLSGDEVIIPMVSRFPKPITLHLFLISHSLLRFCHGLRTSMWLGSTLVCAVVTRYALRAKLRQ